MGFIDAVHYEIAREKVAALGRTEKKLRAALHAYRALEHAGDDADADAIERESMLSDLVAAVTALVVQREACGLRDPEYVLAFYDVPREAVARIGVRVDARS